MSVCLALDWSTRNISVGLRVEDLTLVRTLKLDRFNAPQALGLVTETLKEADCSEKDIEEIRVGRGPGNYTGIRQSLALAIGLAAPSTLSVKAVNSGCLMRPEDPFDMKEQEWWVLGDARRGMWWGARFPSSCPDWLIQPPQQWESLDPSLPVLSAEPERLHPLQAIPGYPSVEMLLSLAGDSVNEPALPLYLHKPV